MHVLVTGGAGFIGSHLAEALLNRGDSVAVLDNLSSGSVENIRRMQDHPRFSLSNEALDNAAALDRLASRADAIVHLAAAVGVHLVLERPTETIETNVLGTHALLGAARRRGCHTLIASTSEVYGKSTALPFSEEDNLLLGPPSRIRWSYAASKLLDEFLGLAAHQEFGLPVTILRLFSRADAIVHLAAAVGVHLVLERPTETIETNVLGTHALLGAARRRGCHTLIASTSEVYGKSTALPFSEEDNLLLGPPSRIRWSYAASKLLDEFLGLAVHQEFGLPVTILRLFNVVGPRQTGRYGAVVPRFVKQALRGEPLTVFGDGAQTRCFCHVSDVVRALLGLLDRPEATGGQIYNVGSDREVAIGELAQQVVVRADSTSSVRHVPYDQAYAAGFEDMRRRVPDISKIEAAIGWTPSLLLPEILDDMIDYERIRLAESR